MCVCVCVCLCVCVYVCVCVCVRERGHLTRARLRGNSRTKVVSGVVSPRLSLIDAAIQSTSVCVSITWTMV